MFKDKVVGVLMGGVSAEREISLATGKAVVSALKKKGYKVIPIDIAPGVINDLNKVDVVFVALHGPMGEDGYIQGLLEWLEIPYTGPSLSYCSLSMDKELSKIIFDSAGINSPKWYKIPLCDIKDSCSFPCVVKPINEGSSVGVSIINNSADLDEYIKNNRYKYVIVEEYIKGREINVGIINGEILGEIEIIPQIDSFYSYKAKYTPGGSKHIVNPELNEELRKKLRETAIAAHKSIGGSDRETVRVDFIAKENDVYILEINALPGLTETSLLPDLAAYQNITFEDLVEKILNKASLRRVYED